MVRSLQPQIIIDNRLGGNIKSKDPEPYAGDFATPEVFIPYEGIVNENGNPIPWESCITIYSGCGYTTKDYYSRNINYEKLPEKIIRMLADCVSKNGNLLFNVGPDAKGRIPEKTAKALLEVGKWMHSNSESIYGCGASEYPKPDWGFYTQKGKNLYAHILYKTINPIRLKDLTGKIKKARLLSDGSEVRLSRLWMVSACHEGYKLCE